MSSTAQFLGLDSFVWFQGVVEDRNDPSKLGRVRVRILGLHTENKTLIPTEELPWAYPIQPIISAAMNGIGYTPLGPVEGTWVVGFFRDGENCQEPVIMGTLGGIPQEAPNSRIGFNDPFEKYPISPEFLEEADTNRLARNEKISETIVQAKIDNLDKDVPVALGADENWDEPNPFYSAEYPFNHVWQTESGHTFELDDTPTRERVRIQHGKSKNFIEMHPNGDQVVKVFGGQAHEAQRFHRASESLRGFNMRQTIAAGATVPISQLVASIALAVIIAIAVSEAAANTLTVGEFVSFVTAMLMLLTPLKHLADVNAPLQRGLASADSVFDVLDAPPEQDTGRIQLQRVSGRIELRGVSYTYPEANRRALDEVNLVIEPGQTVALVGPSGGGKSTLVNLLPRFYQPSSGQVLIDGVDYRDTSLLSLRANIALVSQDVALFNETVAANIAYGRLSEVSRHAIEAAAEAAHALEFIREMPQGFDTVIGDNGVRLSGGQRQRLAIARALLKDATILLLDEATSALDSESERHLQAALATLMRGRTTIVIAHRLSTIEGADRIVALQRGRVVETGSHAELMAVDGLYARLYRIQFALEPDTADQ